MIPGSKKRQINFYDIVLYTALARKHLRLMFLLICAMLMVGLNWYVYARPAYHARALIRMSYVPQPIDSDKVYRDGRVNMLFRELGGTYLLERTAHALGIPGHAKTIALTYIFKVKASQNIEKNLEIDVMANSPELAQKFPEELIRQYTAFRLERRMHDREATIQTYQKDLAELEDKITENRNQRFDQHELQDVTKVEIEAASLRTIPLDLVIVKKRIDDIGKIVVKLADPTLDPVAKLSLINSINEKDASLSVGQEIQTDPDDPNGLNDPLEKEGALHTMPTSAKNDVIVVPQMVKSAQPWEQLVTEAEAIKAKIAEGEQKGYLPGHRIMVELGKQLDDVNRKLGVEVQVAANRLQLQYAQLLNKKTDMESRLPEYEKVQRRLAEITQTGKIYDASQLPWHRYAEDLQKRLEALDFAQDKERIDLQYRELVEAKKVADSPNRFKIAIASLMAGLFLAIGIPFLIEYLDHTLNNLEQVESAFQLRGLGIVPKLADQGVSRSNSGEIERSPSSAENSLVENFRVIRTNLLSMGALTKDPKMIMVTSAVPKEGKTVVASNLAISFAQNSCRTLLMDTDLRRGRLHRLFGYRKSPGLSDVLGGLCTLEEALRPSLHENLTILSAGKHVDRGAELLSSEKFKEVMATLRERYDRILIDTPPVLGLSETSVLQNHVDGVVFVIWSGKTPIRTMQSAIDMLQANGANFYGFVLNRLDLSSSENYYQYYYYSHDYYYHTAHALENS